MTTLILDTTLADCTAVLANGAEVIASMSETLNRGHAERLPGMVDELLVTAGLEYTDLTKVVAVNGPGTFAGVRVAISLAHGIGVATGCSRGGIALHQVLASQQQHDRCAVYITARGGLAMRHLFEGGKPVGDPETQNIDHWKSCPEWDWPAVVSCLPGGDLGDLVQHMSEVAATPAALAAASVDAGDMEALYMRPPDAAKAKQVFKVADR